MSAVNGFSNGSKRLNTSFHDNSNSMPTSRMGMTAKPISTLAAGVSNGHNNMNSSGLVHANNVSNSLNGLNKSRNGVGSISNSSKPSKMDKKVSYEQFAPKSSDLRSKLSKIQNLNCGPIANFSKIKVANSHRKSGSGFGNKSGNGDVNHNVSTCNSFFLQAMAPRGIVSSNTENHLAKLNKTKVNKNEENVDESDPQAQIQKSLALTTRTSHHIQKILTTTTKLHTTLTRTTSLTQTITDRHSSLLQHSSELSLSAERLQSESDQLSHHAKEIGLPLKHYDAVDRLGLVVGVLFKNGVVVKGIARCKVDDDDFENVLKDVDDAVNFFAERSEISMNQSQNGSNGGGQQGSSDLDEDSAASGSVEYYKRSLSLQEACMDLFTTAIATRIQQTSTQVMNALDLKRKSVSGDTLEASLMYTRFHGISSRSRILLNVIKQRMEDECVLVPVAASAYKRRSSSSNSSGGRYKKGINGKGDMVCPYAELWDTCRNAYIQCRLSLLRLSVRNHLDFLKEKHGLIGMTRLASVFLMRLCTAETAMYLDFFGKSEFSTDTATGNSALGENEKDMKSNRAGMNGDGSQKEDASRMINGGINVDQNDASTSNSRNGSTSVSGTTNGKKENDPATLASQVMAKDGTYYDTEFQAFLDELCNNLHRTIRRGIVSIMELDTLCQIVSVLREERSLANASPTTMAAARSLGRVIVDAQERLIFCANGALSKEVVRYKAVPSDLDYPDKLRKCKEIREEKKETNSTSSSENVALLQQMQIYESWFPPIRSVLKVLSKIFRVVEPKVFEDIALSSVQSCAKSLKEGSAYVERKSGQLHSDLFLVKHLLILREQLSPFDIQLRSVERQLDFSDAGKAVSRFLANRNRRLFSMSTENALVTLLREGVHTREASIDSKRDLEDALRSACNDFIEHTAVSLAGPVITFVEQCKSILATDVTLASQSFMTGDYVTAVFTRTLDRLEPQLGEVSTQMSLYMDNTATQSILMKPVIKKIVRVLEDSKQYVLDCAKEDNDKWTDDARAEVFKCIGEIEIMIKTTSPQN